MIPRVVFLASLLGAAVLAAVLVAPLYGEVRELTARVRDLPPPGPGEPEARAVEAADALGRALGGSAAAGSRLRKIALRYAPLDETEEAEGRIAFTADWTDLGRLLVALAAEPGLAVFEVAVRPASEEGRCRVVVRLAGSS